MWKLELLKVTTGSCGSACGSSVLVNGAYFSSSSPSVDFVDFFCPYKGSFSWGAEFLGDISFLSDCIDTDPLFLRISPNENLGFLGSTSPYGFYSPSVYYSSFGEGSDLASAYLS